MAHLVIKVLSFWLVGITEKFKMLNLLFDKLIACIHVKLIAQNRHHKKVVVEQENFLLNSFVLA